MEKLPLCKKKRPWASSLNFEFDVGGQVQFLELECWLCAHLICTAAVGASLDSGTDHHGRQDGGCKGSALAAGRPWA